MYLGRGIFHSTAELLFSKSAFLGRGLELPNWGTLRTKVVHLDRSTRPSPIAINSKLSTSHLEPVTPTLLGYVLRSQVSTYELGKVCLTATQLLHAQLTCVDLRVWPWQHLPYVQTMMHFVPPLVDCFLYNWLDYSSLATVCSGISRLFVVCCAHQIPRSYFSCKH